MKDFCFDYFQLFPKQNNNYKIDFVFATDAILLISRTPGIIVWRDCCLPFHIALECQYKMECRVDTFFQRKPDGTNVVWKHDLYEMLQTNQSTGEVKQLRRIQESFVAL